jgi:hypothetical protein
MVIRLHKISPHRHLLEVVGEGGSKRELDTRSFLRHDLMHWCIERRGRIDGALFGKLERGEPLGAMSTSPGDAPAATALHGTEMLVGMLQGAEGRDADPDEFVAAAREWFALQGQQLPAFCDAAFVRNVLADYRQLYGQWQSLRIGGVLELRGFP